MKQGQPSDFLRGAAAGIPVLIGYFPVAVTFGVLSSGYLPLSVSVLMSAFVYAGASQFMALQLLGTGTGVFQIVFAVFMLNFRHFLMNSSLARKLISQDAGHGSKKPVKVPKLLLFSLVTDETFSVFMTAVSVPTGTFLFGLEIVAYGSWVLGTGLGFLIGSFLPPVLQESMGTALYALFIALLVPSVKRSLPAGAVAAAAASVHTLLRSASDIGAGWSIIIAIIAGAVIGALLFPEPEREAP
jgi:4-azaleucine resistance transporter AzlC